MAKGPSPMRKSKLLHILLNVVWEVDMLDRLWLEGCLEESCCFSLHVFDL